MAVKKEASSKSKSKGGELIATDEATAPFGLKVHDMVRTPVGLLGTVLGVRLETASDKDSARVWVRYNNGHEAPLEPRAAGLNANIEKMGYSRQSEAAHIRRDVATQAAEAAQVEQQRRVIEEVLRLKAAGEPIPEHLLPPAKEEKASKKASKKKGDGEDGKKAKKKK